MLEFILQIVLMMGLSGIILIAARALPRVPESETGLAMTLEQWIASWPLHKIDEFLRVNAHKLLRKVRLGLLKLDNKIGAYLEKTKDLNGENGKNGRLDIDKLRIK